MKICYNDSEGKYLNIAIFYLQVVRQNWKDQIKDISQVRLYSKKILDLL